MSRALSSKTFGGNFIVHIVPVLKDNYSYVVQCCRTNEAALIDVADAPVMVRILEQLQIQKFSVLTTHKHSDHCGGNNSIAHKFRGTKFFAGLLDNVPCVTNPLKDGDQFAVGGLTVRTIHTPCHTKGHVVYHVFHQDDVERGAVFTGDTLFVGGIGAFFEGCAADMVGAVRKLAQLPSQTAVYPGHEYTLNFLRWAVTFEPENEFMAEKLKFFESLRKDGNPTHPSTIGDERRINLFLRVHDADLQKKTFIKDPLKLMEHLYNSCP